MKRPTLLALQLAVGLAMLLVWHVLTTIPIGGRKLLDPFFFSTPVMRQGARCCLSPSTSSHFHARVGAAPGTAAMT